MFGGLGLKLVFFSLFSSLLMTRDELDYSVTIMIPWEGEEIFFYALFIHFLP